MLFASFLAACTATEPEKKAAEGTYDGELNILMLADAGRNGSYDQRLVSEWMGVYADELGPEFVISCGDLFHYEGIQSTRDPLLWSNFENIYTHGELQCPWYGVLGNHEYRGNTQAVLDYGGVSRRWVMPGRYYTKAFEVDDDTSLRVVWVDTTPLIDKYHEEAEESYRDIAAQDMEAQLRWIDSTLTASDETWKIVIGHHPIYADTDKDEEERLDLQERLDTILRRHGVDMYICGHIHNFQHIRRAGSDVDYVVNTSGSLSRDVRPIEGTLFCSSATGFSVVSASADSLKLYMLDKDRNILHTVERGRNR